MKAFLLASVLAFTGLSATAQADKLSEAQAAFASRDYTDAGVQNALNSAKLYRELASEAQAAGSTFQAHTYIVNQSEALYFAGNATEEGEDNKERFHLEGFETAFVVVKAFGITDFRKVSDAKLDELKKLPPEQLQLLGEALYFHGINFGQWGLAKGITTTLTRWDELRENMNLINNLGLEQIHEYGARRVLGRAFMKLPLSMGDKKKSERFLTQAVNGSLAPGQIYSTNGTNNIYYADILIENGKESKAKEFLEQFVKADPATLHPEMIPENVESIRLALKTLRKL